MRVQINSIRLKLQVWKKCEIMSDVSLKSTGTRPQLTHWPPSVSVTARRRNGASGNVEDDITTQQTNRKPKVHMQNEKSSRRRTCPDELRAEELGGTRWKPHGAEANRETWAGFRVVSDDLFSPSFCHSYRSTVTM